MTRPTAAVAVLLLAITPSLRAEQPEGPVELELVGTRLSALQLTDLQLTDLDSEREARAVRLFRRAAPHLGIGTPDDVLQTVDGDRLWLKGIPTGPWFEETHTVWGFLQIRYSESPLCRRGDPHRLLGAN